MNIFSQIGLIINALHNYIAGLKPMARLLVRVVIMTTAAQVSIRNTSGMRKFPERAVFALNHSTEADAFIVPCWLMALHRRKISFFIHWMFRHFPLVGWLLHQIDPIWVENRETQKKWLLKYRRKRHGYPVQEAVKRIEQGGSVGIFPEGGLNRNSGRLNRGRLGIGEIVLETHAPVVPVGVDFPVRRNYGKMPLFGRMEIAIGKPMYFDKIIAQWEKGHSGNTNDEQESRLFKNRLCQGIAHETMRAIAPLCGKRYPFQIKKFLRDNQFPPGFFPHP